MGRGSVSCSPSPTHRMARPGNTGTTPLRGPGGAEAPPSHLPSHMGQATGSSRPLVLRALPPYPQPHSGPSHCSLQAGWRARGATPSLHPHPEQNPLPPHAMLVAPRTEWETQVLTPTSTPRSLSWPLSPVLPKTFIHSTQVFPAYSLYPCRGH